MTSTLQAIVWTWVMFSIAPREPTDRLYRVAQVVTLATPDVREQALLLTVSFYETTWERRGIPYGVSSRYSAQATAEWYAQAALAILRRSADRCPPTLAHRLGYYHHGNGCRVDDYSRAEARMVGAMLARYNSRTPYLGGHAVLPVGIHSAVQRRVGDRGTTSRATF